MNGRWVPRARERAYEQQEEEDGVAAERNDGRFDPSPGRSSDGTIHSGETFARVNDDPEQRTTERSRSSFSLFFAT